MLSRVETAGFKRDMDAAKFALVDLQQVGTIQTNSKRHLATEF